MSRKLSSFEEKVMRWLGLKDVVQLDELFAHGSATTQRDNRSPLWLFRYNKTSEFS